jgi:hypothetical protein
MTKLNPTPAVNCQYGAPMGRSSDHLSGLIVEPQEKVTLRRIRINSGGYDSGGAYWGLGQPLFWWSITQEGEESSGFLRASSRDAAKRQIVELHPGAKFYR